jgi:LysM repeat protein
MKFDLFSKLKEIPKPDINFLVLLPVIFMIAAVVGNAYFFVMNTNPALQANSKVGTDLDKSRNALAAPGRIPATNPDAVRAQLVTVKATIAASLGVFLSGEQANTIINTFSQYASASGVQVLSLQSQPATTVKDLYNVTVVKLQVQGESHNLIDFASRIKISFPVQGLVINNVTLTNGDTPMALMTLDMALYTTAIPQIPTPIAEQSKLNVAAPTSATPLPTPTALSLPPLLVPIAPTATPIPPTPMPIVPTATSIPPTPTQIYPTAIPRPPPVVLTVYIVRAGDTLFSIAQRYGTTIEVLMVANQLPNYIIRIGQPLQIPMHP